MAFYRRRLPHVYQTGQPIFLTWRLQDSLPPNRVFPSEAQTSGQAFAAMDCLLEETRTDGDGIGPGASLAVETIEVGEQVLSEAADHGHADIQAQGHDAGQPEFLVFNPRSSAFISGQHLFRTG
jgi:hypothetical protein